MKYISYLAIEKKPAFRGMALSDLLLAVLVFVLLLLFGAFLLIIGINTPYWFGFTLVEFIISVVFLKTKSRKGHPAFFLSYISYLLLQPRKLRPEYGKLSLKIKNR